MRTTMYGRKSTPIYFFYTVIYSMSMKAFLILLLLIHRIANGYIELLSISHEKPPQNLEKTLFFSYLIY